MGFIDLEMLGKFVLLAGQGPCLKSRKSLLYRVGTGSGSDLVGDQHAIFLNAS